MLTEQIIKNLTNINSFARGEKYYKQGRVKDYSDTEDLLEAIVVGTDDYKVEIDLTNLDYNCPCYAFNGDQLCKHLVAVLLTKLYGKIKSEDLIQTKKKPRKTPIKDFLKTVHTKSKLTKEDYKEIQHEIRSEFTGLGYRNSRDWYRYVRNLDLVSNHILQIIDKLPTNKDSCKFILEQVYWIHEKKLTTLDDSDAIVSDLAYTMVIRAVEYLDQKQADLSIIWNFTSREHSFDLGVNIIEAILEHVQNENVLKELSSKIEKSRFKIDPDFNFNNSYVWVGYMNYLAENDYEKFKDLAVEVTGENILAKQIIANKLIENKDYELFITLFEDDTHPSYSKLLREAYKETRNWDKLIEWYEENLFGENLFRGFSIKELKKLKALIFKHKNEKYWDKTIAKSKKQLGNSSDAIDLYLYLKDFDRVYELLTKFPKKDYKGDIDTSEIESYATKLQITHEQTAAKLYKFLIENELERFKGYHNRYDNFLNWLNTLWYLGENEFVYETKNVIFSNFQNKKKLVERLSLLYKAKT